VVPAELADDARAERVLPGGADHLGVRTWKHDQQEQADYRIQVVHRTETQ